MAEWTKQSIAKDDGSPVSLSNGEAFQTWLFILIGPGAVSTNLRLVGWRGEGPSQLGVTTMKRPIWKGNGVPSWRALYANHTCLQVTFPLTNWDDPPCILWLMRVFRPKTFWAFGYVQQGSCASCCSARLLRQFLMPTKCVNRKGFGFWLSYPFQDSTGSHGWDRFPHLPPRVVTLTPPLQASYARSHVGRLPSDRTDWKLSARWFQSEAWHK